MNISVNPSYYCNFRCGFCYLTEQQLSDRTLIDLEMLNQRLAEVVEKYGTIDHIDLYGGEPALLPTAYFETMTAIFLQYTDSLSLNTNLSAVNTITTHPAYDVSVSYDFEARESHELVYRNMLTIPRKVSVLMLASPTVLKKSIPEMIQMFNLNPNIVSVEIKPYSSNQANDLAVTDVEYEQFVRAWLTDPTPRNFEDVNSHYLDRVLAGEQNSWGDDHIYITPQGSFAVLEFDQNNREYFRSLSSLEEFDAWTREEKLKQQSNAYCGPCDYLGGCLSECGWRAPTSIDQSCNGFLHLIQWYKNEIHS